MNPVVRPRRPHQNAISRVAAALVALLTCATTIAAGADRAHAASTTVARVSCAPAAAPAGGRYRVNATTISGLVRPATVTTGRACPRAAGTSTADSSTDSSTDATVTAIGDPAVGTPPLLDNGGPVMGTPSVGDEVVLHPIFWAPPGYSFPSGYQDLIDRYLHDVAAASGSHGNVFATTAQYGGSNGQVHYGVAVAPDTTVTDPFPTSGCTLDVGGVYADGSGYTTCLDDTQIDAEVATVVGRLGAPTGYGHLYLLFTPEQVESCFYAGAPPGQQCTINATPSSSFCAYHSSDGSGVLYADLPFPVYQSPTGQTCASDGSFVGGAIQSPNGDVAADAEVSLLSHEAAEAITDPDGNAWYDANGYENGDECAYVYGTVSGSPGALYNQTIAGDHWLTQEEFSNADYRAGGGGGCVQGMLPTVTSLTPASGATAGGTSVDISGLHFTGATAVHFGGIAATSFTVVDDTEITATTPPGVAGGVPVTVTDADGSTAGSTDATFLYQPQVPPPPTVSGLRPTSGPTGGGTHVTISGSDLTGATAVTFGSVDATSFTVLGPTEIVAVAPAHPAGDLDVAVTTPGGTSAAGAADRYGYVARPVVTAITPTSGPRGGGTLVVVTGRHFVRGTAVLFGMSAGRSVRYRSPTMITVRTPAHARATVAVRVRDVGGTSAATTRTRFTFRATA